MMTSARSNLSIMLSSLRTKISIPLFLLALVSPSAVGTVLIESEKGLPGKFLICDELPAESPPEARIAAYERTLEWPVAAGEEGQEERPSMPSFIDVAVDFSALVDPEDALAAAYELVPSPASADLYERLGIALLSAARLARLGDDSERASGHLHAARHAFALADREAAVAGEGSQDDSGSGLIHRAMVGLEEILVTRSEDGWEEASKLLTRHLEHTLTGPRADWAWRMLYYPETYVGEEEVSLEGGHQVGGAIRKPGKIFTPQARFTHAARQARIQGVVIAQAVIDGHGNVAALKLIKGLPMGLSDEALRTMATWLFEPAKFEEQPVVVTYFLAMRFQL